MTNVVNHLVRLGLSVYEARAYVAIVTLGEGTIKEISEESGVPRSRTYDVMERLAEKGFVEEGGSSPRRYRANEPLVASNHLMEDIRRANDEILKELNEIGRKAESREMSIWTVKGEWAIDHKVGEIMESANKEVTILCFNNRSIVRYARLFSSTSEQKQVTVIISKQVDSFDGFLGGCRVMRIGSVPGYPNEIGGTFGERGYVTKDGMYCIEMLLRSDRDSSLLLTREGDARRAIVVNGTILNFFSRESMEYLIQVAEEMPDTKAPSPKRA